MSGEKMGKAPEVLNGALPPPKLGCVLWRISS